MADSPFAPRVDQFDLQTVIAETIAHHGLPMKATWRWFAVTKVLLVLGDCVLIDGTPSLWSVSHAIKGTRTKEHVRQQTEMGILRVHRFLEESQAEGTTFVDAMTPEQRYEARTAPEVVG